MEWVEITARTVREATDQALDQLGVDESDAEIEVVEEPRPGLFGRTRGKARVRARVVPRPHPPKQERRDRKRGGRSSGGGGGGRGRGGDGGSREGRRRPTPRSTTPTPPARRPTPVVGRSRRRRRRERQWWRRWPGGVPAPRPTARRERRRPERPTSRAKETTWRPTSFPSTSTSRASGTSSPDWSRPSTPTPRSRWSRSTTRPGRSRSTGDDLGLLIGPRGLTLQAVARAGPHRRVPQGARRPGGPGPHRHRRLPRAPPRGARSSSPPSIAEEVRESGRAKALEPMSPPDRKVVHDTINDVDGVRTTSEGEEPRRRVVVLPD